MEWVIKEVKVKEEAVTVLQDLLEKSLAEKVQHCDY
jgi:hypothetical protein